MRAWMTLAGLFVASGAFGYWAVYTWRFLEDVLPHGGMW